MKLSREAWRTDVPPGGFQQVEALISGKVLLTGIIRAELTLKDGTVLKGQIPLAVRQLNVSQQSPPGYFVEAENPGEEKGGKLVVVKDRADVHGYATSHWDRKGHAVTYQIDLPKAGKYELLIRYAAERPVVKRELILNGTDFGSFEIPPTGGFGRTKFEWSDYRFGMNGTPLQFSLPAGRQTLTMIHDGGSLNMDYISLIPVK